MKESQTIKEYSGKLLGLVNNVRHLSTKLSDVRIVQKILVTIPEKFEAAIVSLENTRDFRPLPWQNYQMHYRHKNKEAYEA
jgi:hypothetical protein